MELVRATTNQRSTPDLDIHLPLIQAGDADAFGRWVAGAEDRIRASLNSFARIVDTEAVVQETLLRVWQVAPRFQADSRPNSLIRFAIRIARNLAIDASRRRRVTPAEIEQLERAANRATSDPAPPDPLLRETIAKCFQALPERPRHALQQRISARGNRHDVELAKEVGMKLNTFLQNIRRARLSLSECLRSHGVRIPGEDAS